MRTFKKCPCGAVFSVADWRGLPFVGISVDHDDEIETERVCELRNCSRCSSTLMITLSTSTTLMELVRRALNDGAAMHAALRDVQARCTELLEENRRLKLELIKLKAQGDKERPA